MHFTAISCALCVLVLFRSIAALDGIAVAVEDVRLGGGTQARMPPGTNYGYPMGAIVRIDFVNNIPGPQTTIFPSTTSMAIQPRISVDGKYVYFFRTAGPTDSTTYLTVMDIDGKNVRDLASFNKPITQFDQFPDRYANWPAGDTMYFQKPRTTEIHRIRVSDPAAGSTLVRTFPVMRNEAGGPYIERWWLNAGGNVAQHYQALFKWPSCTDSAKAFEAGGCNFCLSASGRFQNGWQLSATNLWNLVIGHKPPYGWWPEKYAPENGRQIALGGHAYYEFTDWDWKTGNRPKFSQYFNDHFNYRHLSYMIGTQKLQSAIGRPSLGAWSSFVRWSCNSDKWIMHAPGPSNHDASGPQVLFNWADRQAVLGLHSKVKNGAVYCAGDLWVKPPDAFNNGRYYEDCRGNWQVVGSQSTVPLPDYVSCPGVSKDINNEINKCECALKYQRLVIMPQAVYNQIASNTQGIAVLIPDFEDSSLVLPKGGSTGITVTNEFYDPVNPIFGGRTPAYASNVTYPPVTPQWRIVSQNPAGSVSLSSATGVSTTLNATSAFVSCTVEVTITLNAVTNSTKKYVSTSSVFVGKPTAATVSSRGSASTDARVRVIALHKGSLRLEATDQAIVSAGLFNANGVLVQSAAIHQGTATISCAGISRGMHLIRLKTEAGEMLTARFFAR